MIEIPLIKPAPPDVALFQKEIEEIWQSNQFTNNGAKVRELEGMLADYLKLDNAIAYSSCTAALIAVFKSMDLTGEIITTPFTFIASINAIILSGLKPVLVDVDSEQLNLDPSKVEAAIGPRTCAIMPVHVYGNPCDLDAYDDLSKRYNVPVVYDAAQAFGVESDGESILTRGAASVISTHATKVFSTVEGGFVCNVNNELKARLEDFRNFGFSGSRAVSSIGANGKMSELHAAFGLSGMATIEQCLERRKSAYEEYVKCINNGSSEGDVICYPYSQKFRQNYNYMPVKIRKENVDLDMVVESLSRRKIGSKRYFSPLVNQFQGMPSGAIEKRGSLSNAENAARSILCLPMFDGITDSQIANVVENLMEII